MKCNDTQINAIACELARIYCIGWQQHADLIGEQKSHLTPKEWAECNGHMFTTEAVELLYKLKNEK